MAVCSFVIGKDLEKLHSSWVQHSNFSEFRDWWSNLAGRNNDSYQDVVDMMISENNLGAHLFTEDNVKQGRCLFL